jgi:hypothetical protein
VQFVPLDVFNAIMLEMETTLALFALQDTFSAQLECVLLVLLVAVFAVIITMEFVLLVLRVAILPQLLLVLLVL